MSLEHITEREVKTLQNRILTWGLSLYYAVLTAIPAIRGYAAYTHNDYDRAITCGIDAAAMVSLGALGIGYVRHLMRKEIDKASDKPIL